MTNQLSNSSHVISGFAEARDFLFISKMSSTDEAPKKGQNQKSIRDMLIRKRPRLENSSDDEDDESEQEKFDNQDLLRVLESGENIGYQDVPVSLNLTEDSGLPVEFEELVIKEKRTGFVRCKTENCSSRSDPKVFYGHFKAHQTDKKRTRLYKKTIFERHITRWHKPKLILTKPKVAGTQMKLGQKFGFQNQLTKSFKSKYKEKTMTMLAKKGLPLNFCEDDSFKVPLNFPYCKSINL